MQAALFEPSNQAQGTSHNSARGVFSCQTGIEFDQKQAYDWIRQCIVEYPICFPNPHSKARLIGQCYTELNWL